MGLLNSSPSPQPLLGPHETLFSEKYPAVRAEKLVGTAGEEVTIEVLDVDQPVRRIVNGVDEEECIR